MKTIQPKTIILEKEDLDKLGIKGAIRGANAQTPKDPKAYNQGRLVEYTEIRISVDIEE
jgi:hypothetical protein